MSTLEVCSVELADSGGYSCIVESSATIHADTEMTQLTVMVKPGGSKFHDNESSTKLLIHYVLHI